MKSLFLLIQMRQTKTDLANKNKSAAFVIRPINFYGTVQRVMASSTGSCVQCWLELNIGFRFVHFVAKYLSKDYIKDNYSI